MSDELPNRLKIEKLKELAESNDVEAQFLLGTEYLNGENIPQNYNEAVFWLEEAAKKGNSSAQFKLGLIYKRGLGVTKDENLATYWYNQAASQDASLQSLFSEASKINQKAIQLSQNLSSKLNFLFDELSEKYIQRKKELEDINKHKVHSYRSMVGGGLTCLLFFLMPHEIGTFITSIGLWCFIYGLVSYHSKHMKLRQQDAIKNFETAKTALIKFGAKISSDEQTIHWQGQTIYVRKI